MLGRLVGYSAATLAFVIRGKVALASHDDRDEEIRATRDASREQMRAILKRRGGSERGRISRHFARNRSASGAVCRFRRDDFGRRANNRTGGHRWVCARDDRSRDEVEISASSVSLFDVATCPKLAATAGVACHPLSLSLSLSVQVAQPASKKVPRDYPSPSSSPTVQACSSPPLAS